MKTRSIWTCALAASLVSFAIIGCGGGSPPASDTASPAAEAVAISVTEEGFVPKEIHVKAGQPVTLAVTRKTERTCATELVLKEYTINQKLPLNETVEIKFTPKETGQLTYACGMDMIKGHIVVD
jgi:plastocyanin domain-containing protein